MSDEGLALATKAMNAAGQDDAMVADFASRYRLLEQGGSGMIPEATIAPLLEVDQLDQVQVDPEQARDALAHTVVLRLNGGLGTSMGLDRAKSLLEVRDGLSFLDITVRQVLAARKRYGVRLPLVFMDSFRTQADTAEALAKYPELAVDGLPISLLQGQVPKLRADDLTPVSWPEDPSLEWCPPGHGDVYRALYSSGLLDQLVEAGFRYLSLSNGDNLGAAPDERVAGWFASTGAPYAAELCRRTANDRKGGHLAIRKADGQLVLRDTAQTPAEEMDYFTDEHRHPFFHTNNLWVDLRALQSVLGERGGVLGLPLIRNDKTVDPSDGDSTPVVQVESAMGAAIEVFPGATAICVGRDRFLPVKTTNELLLLRSDLYELDNDYRLVAHAETPAVKLGKQYKLVGDFARLVPHPLALRQARSLAVDGEVAFGRDVQVVGDVAIEASEPTTIADGTVLEG
ncbi:UTP--glucose-1-phosphate uridylyltransferase [Luteococcus sanguinis]|uniref:UTP--glucose-1-phosphate uridylyltransferase n=1 Tax=Luteococcus sanguinis TaxID=174038 RepID=A0ABW1X3I2_9ACTN